MIRNSQRQAGHPPVVYPANPAAGHAMPANPAEGNPARGNPAEGNPARGSPDNPSE